MKQRVIGGLLAAVVLALAAAVVVHPSVIIDCEYLWPLCWFV